MIFEVVLMDDFSLKGWFKREYSKLKQLTWKQRFGYIWDYYKPFMAAIIGIIVVINIGYTMFKNLHTDTILSVYFVNSLYAMTDEEELGDQYIDYIGGLEKNQDFVLDLSVSVSADDSSEYSYANQIKFSTLSAAGSIDVCLMDPEDFDSYSDLGFYGDLREALSDEELDKWSDLLIYTKDEEGEEYPCGIDLSESSILLEYNLYPQGVCGGISVNGNKSEDSAPFFEWLLS